MRISTLTAAAALAAFAASPAGAAVFTDLGPISGPQPVGPAPVAETPTGAYEVFTTSSDTTRSPYDGLAFSGSFFSIPSDVDNAPPGSATFNITGETLKLLWGSPDTYNEIEFFSAPNGVGTSIDTVTGTDLFNSSVQVFEPDTSCKPRNASTGEGCGYANVAIDPDGASFQSVKLSSEKFAFEGGIVPLPAAAWLMIGGLGAVGAVGRYARRKTADDVAA